MAEQTAAPRGDSRRFQILSLDGGGIRGLYSAAVLAAIEQDLRTDVTKHFDLIAGTSTGGIIALGLGLGLRPAQIVEFYRDEGKKIFRGPGWLRHLLSFFTRKYGANPLVEALRRYFGERSFGTSTKRLVIPSYNLGEDEVYIFRTPHHEKLRRDYAVPAWQVARATSAAPTYFPLCRDVDGQRLVDGGVWANNPVMVAIVEAHRFLGAPLDDIHVFSIGTTSELRQRKSSLDKGGKLAWIMGEDVIDLIMRGQSMSANNHATLLLGEERMMRVNPVVRAGEFELDGAHRASDLIAKAAHQSRSLMPAFQKRFGSHTATPYEPLYR